MTASNGVIVPKTYGMTNFQELWASLSVPVMKNEKKNIRDFIKYIKFISSYAVITIIFLILETN